MEINSSSPEIVVLTGWRGAGKTSLLLRLTAQAIKAGWRVGGLLAPARIEDGQKTGIEVADAHTGERRLLASLIQGELHGPRVGNWSFDEGSFVWGDGILRRSLPCDLFVLDELGPLEFEHQQGWSAGFDLLAQLRPFDWQSSSFDRNMFRLSWSDFPSPRQLPFKTWVRSTA